MINRTMLRTKVIQTLFAYYKDNDKTPSTAKKELYRNFSDAYNLYFLLLGLADEIVRYAQEQIADAKARAKVTHITYIENRRFVESHVAHQLWENRQLRNHLDNQHLSWDAAQSAIAAVWKQIQECSAYQEFMEAEAYNYELDKKLWKKIYSVILPQSEELVNAVEDLELHLDAQNWTTDLDVVLSYTLKTIKKIEENDGADFKLLEMFDNEGEVAFAEALLNATISHKEEYSQLIKDHLVNWDADRIAYMDHIILLVATAEILCFPDIAVEITMNEYLEIAKEYSSEKSYIFINGILNEVMKDLKKAGKLFKPIR